MHSSLQKVGSWAFIIGVCLAVVLGIYTNAAASPWVLSVLVIAGLIVGVLNVRHDEAKDFLLASVALVILANFGGDVLGVVPGLGAGMSQVFDSLVMLIVPAAVIVAVKSIYTTAKDE